VSGTTEGVEIDLSAINGALEGDGGIAHGALLVAFSEAVMAGDEAAMAEKRRAVIESLGPAAFVDTCAVIGSFNVVDRIADAIGIPLDEVLEGMSQDVRDELDLARFTAAG